MLLGTDDAASRTCRVRPYISRRGKLSVIRYTSVTSAIAFCHAIRPRTDSAIRRRTSLDHAKKLGANCQELPPSSLELRANSLELPRLFQLHSIQRIRRLHIQQPQHRRIDIRDIRRPCRGQLAVHEEDAFDDLGVDGAVV